MCGIAGLLDQNGRHPITQHELRLMLGAIRHRGPDEFGVYLDGRAGLGSARMSVIDLCTGQQPIPNEDGTLWIVFNGEIYNYLELREELSDLGHHFRTQSDTEVLLHLYEQLGPRCLERLNGQFAFAVWNVRERVLFLARDRLGVRPLFYTTNGGRFIFASEIKAILTQRQVRAEIDPAVLQEVFTFWAPLAPRSIFRGILEIPPGHYLVARQAEVTVKPYWQIAFPAAGPDPVPALTQDEVEQQVEQFATLLVDAARIRLRADVPVGAYLSGGLDSSTLAAIVRNFTTNRLKTFSIAFSDPDFDESAYQQQMAHFLGTEHHVARVDHADIGQVFPEVVWHAEAPLMRTAPAPMFLLSKLVRECGFKVVLTGEGADEFLAGYDIFKEAKVRRFWARAPASELRPRLFQRLYPDLTGLCRNHPALLASFFKDHLTEVDSPTYSHAIRWRNNLRTCQFFSAEVRQHIQGQATALIPETLRGQFQDWAALARAQYLEITIFLSQYLLSSQGDRMAMAHAVEGRFPFLDYRLTEFCNRLPESLKLRALTEKYLLKKLSRRWLPPEILRRPKRPYRAPIHRCFFTRPVPEYVRELLSEDQLRASGLFAPAAVNRLLRKVEQGGPPGETNEMALVGILSAQLLHHRFVAAFEMPRPLSEADPVKVCSTPNPEHCYELQQECFGHYA